jgi:hypothetical protein
MILKQSSYGWMNSDKLHASDYSLNQLLASISQCLFRVCMDHIQVNMVQISNRSLGARYMGADFILLDMEGT